MQIQRSPLVRAALRGLLATALTAAAVAQSEVYVAQGGLLVVEFESGHSAGHWRVEDQLAGHTGSGYLRWDGPNFFNEPGHDTFGFEFELSEPGRYHFRLHNRHDHPDSTEENDVWIRMDGGPWIKTFSWQRGQWTWTTQHELSHTNKPPAEYQLTAGRHTLEFSGRSTNFMIDRFHLYRDGTPNAESLQHAESPRLSLNQRPVAMSMATPDRVEASAAATTIVTLDSRRSFDPDSDPLDILWETRGTTFVGGTTPRSAVAQVRVPAGIALPVRLVVAERGGERLHDTAHLYVDTLPSAARVVDGGSVWYPLELQFEGPETHEAATSPNPFLDYRLQVRFVAADGTTFDVPGYYAGDGNGGGTGRIWAVRFTPDRAGIWTWTASFRTGQNVNVSLDPSAGAPTHFDGATGNVGVLPRDTNAPGFRAAGRLEYVGEHYLKQRDGGFWIKTGTNSPENFLAYVGFDDVTDLGGVGLLHRYERHVQDYRPGDPYWVGNSGLNSRGIIGALNYLGEAGMNAIYFLPMNLGGDGQDTHPFITPGQSFSDKTHYDVSRLHQWRLALEHAQDVGLLLHFVLAETEASNENWLDNGQLGVERKLFFREMSARFGSALGLKWNLSEENDYSVALLRDFADYLAAVDPYGHPIAVHTHPDDISLYEQIKGDPRFSAASVQYSTHNASALSQSVRTMTRTAGRKWVVDLDENGTWNVGLSDSNIDEMRREVLYDVLFSGANIEWYAGYHDLPLGGDVRLEDFRTRQRMWRYSRIARQFMLDHLPLTQLEPSDHLVTGEAGDFGGAEVFALPGEVYAVYLPNASQGFQIDLTAGTGPFQLRWFDPREGGVVGSPTTLAGGALRSVPPPLVGAPALDWVALLERTGN